MQSTTSDLCFLFASHYIGLAIEYMIFFCLILFWVAIESSSPFKLAHLTNIVTKERAHFGLGRSHHILKEESAKLQINSMIIPLKNQFLFCRHFSHSNFDYTQNSYEYL